MVANDLNSTALRICSIAWAPSLPSRKRDDAHWERRYGTQILAIGQDNDSIQFLEVSSPFTTESGEWTCKKLNAMKSTGKNSLGIPNDMSDSLLSTQRSRYSRFKDAMQTSHLIEDIHLGPWKTNDNGFETTVTSRTDYGRRHTSLFHMDSETNQSQIEFVE